MVVGCEHEFLKCNNELKKGETAFRGNCQDVFKSKECEKIYWILVQSQIERNVGVEKL